MQSRSPSAIQRRSRFALGVYALILMGMFLGAIVSSVGGVTSHGLAEFSASQHKLDAISVAAHGHTHDDEEPAFSEAGADHAHHGADHSHDKSHAPFSAMTIAISLAASRPATTRPWVELVETFRLERPPMA